MASRRNDAQTPLSDEELAQKESEELTTSGQEGEIAGTAGPTDASQGRHLQDQNMDTGPDRTAGIEAPSEEEMYAAAAVKQHRIDKAVEKALAEEDGESENVSEEQS